MNVIRGNLQVTGTLSPGALAIPAGTIVDAAIAESAQIAASKLVHQFPVRYSQPGGADVVDASVPIHLIHGVSATVHAVQIVCSLAPAGGDKRASIDLQAGHDGGAFASILSAPAVYDNTLADRQVLSAVIAAPDLLAGRTLRLVVSALGSTGTQAQGLLVVVWMRERAQ